MTVFPRMVLALAVTVAGLALARAQNTQTPYPTKAPLDQYLIADRNAEIALARTAAPKSISDDAEVMVLSKEGYEVAVQGTNHFVCFVERSWDAAIGDPVFWNPKIRGPNCVNEEAARSWLPIALMKTRLAVSGQSQQEIDRAMQLAFREKKLPELEPGAMCYMLSKQGYLNDAARNWRPHLMFFVPLAMSKTWGANLTGSPILSGDDASDHLTIFMIPVAHWSDGTPDAGAN